MTRSGREGFKQGSRQQRQSGGIYLEQEEMWIGTMRERYRWDKGQDQMSRDDSDK